MQDKQAMHFNDICNIYEQNDQMVFGYISIVGYRLQ